MVHRRSPLIVDIAALRRRHGGVLAVRKTVTIDAVEITSSRLHEGRVEVDISIENVVDGVVAKGRIRATATGECRRCLEPVSDRLDLPVHEIFELHSTEGETWPIQDDRIDLEPMVRECLLLALPLAPLCRDDCLGPQPDRFPTGTPAEAPARDAGSEEGPVDPRWAALGELEFDE